MVPRPPKTKVRTLWNDLLSKVAAGLTSLEVLARVTI
jgi:hypothetical protein